MSPAVDLDACLAGWDPPPVALDDAMDPAPTQALAAVLDRPAPDGPGLPALWHWVHFVSWSPTASLGPDGHPSGGDFLPPIPERTRMFVGGRLEIPVGLRTGVVARRRSALVARSLKHGRSGSMVLVTVRHEIFQDDVLAVVDEQDLMYRSGAAARREPAPRDAATSDPGPGPSSDAPWQEPFTVGPVTLFRFSALTANSHRIHYDEPYVTGVEGYPGLVVHGPLLAVALAGLAEREASGRRLISLRYRFVRPVFAGDRVMLTGRPHDDGAEMAVVGADGEARAVAEAGYRA